MSKWNVENISDVIFKNILHISWMFPESAISTIWAMCGLCWDLTISGQVLEIKFASKWESLRWTVCGPCADDIKHLRICFEFYSKTISRQTISCLCGNETADTRASCQERVLSGSAPRHARACRSFPMSHNSHFLRDIMKDVAIVNLFSQANLLFCLLRLERIGRRQIWNGKKIWNLEHTKLGNASNWRLSINRNSGCRSSRKYKRNVIINTLRTIDSWKKNYLDIMVNWVEFDRQESYRY